LLQPIERGIDGPGRHGAFEAVPNFVQDGAAIAFATKRRARVREREEDSLFERSEIPGHVVYIVYNEGTRDKCLRPEQRSAV
jgi:hypothetical protein